MTKAREYVGNMARVARQHYQYSDDVLKNEDLQEDLNKNLLAFIKGYMHNAPEKHWDDGSRVDTYSAFIYVKGSVFMEYARKKHGN